jgi:hypothetical protein
MMLAMEDWLIVGRRIVIQSRFCQILGRRLAWRGRHGLPRAEPDPRTLLLAGILNVEQANGLTVLLELVFDFGNDGQGLGTSEVDAAVLQLAGIEHGYGNEAAGLGTSFVARKLQYGDGAKLGAVFGVLGHLAGILGDGGQGGRN